MKKKYQLRIENPCQKKGWEEMEAGVRGNYCSICTKNVFDFAMWTDHEIITLISNADEAICARLNTAQVNRIMSIQEKPTLSYWPKVAASLLLLTSFSTVHATAVILEKPAQYQALKKITNQLQKLPEKDLALNDTTKNTISGKLIRRNDKTPIPGIPIQIKGTELKTATDSLGQFELTIPENFRQNEIVLLVIASYGFEGKTQKIVYKSELPIKNLIIEKGDVLIGEVSFSVKKKKKWWQFWKW